MCKIEADLIPGTADMDAGSSRRLTLNVDGASVAFVEFYLFGKVAIVTHTEVEPAHQGKGLGSIVASRALQHFREENLNVVPVCGFFLQQIRRHPDHADLLTPCCRRIFAV